MDKQQLFLSNNIFDIDSALDRLEENLFTIGDEKISPAISIEQKLNLQQNVDTVTQQQNKDLEEENGNKTLSDGGVPEVLEDNKCEDADNKVFNVSSFIKLRIHFTFQFQ